MLNKNQSKKRNYWKYYAVIPALVAFVFVFQIKTIAQEKKEAKEVSEKISSVDVYKIKKTTTDEELKTMSEKLKQNHDVDVIISDVKRNSKNELTSIKVDIQKGTGEDQTIQIEGNNAIKSCGIIITTEDDGTKKINLVTDGGMDEPMVIKNRIVEVRETGNQDVSSTYPEPPAPPTMPVFPSGPMPAAPAVDMSKMPKPPVPPLNPKEKTAMKNYQKEMAEFERKMESFEPDMSAYEKQVEEIMEKRSAIFDKEMEKYDLAMEKFNADMEKYNEDIEQKYGENSKQCKQNMEQHKKDMKQHAKDMKEHEKNMKRMEQESK